MATRKEIIEKAQENMMTKIIKECKRHPECAFKNPPHAKDRTCKLMSDASCGCLVGDIPEAWDVSFLQQRIFSGEEDE